MPQGKITVIAGCMFACKSDTLIAKAKREFYRQRTVLCYKSSRDTRYDVNYIVSHAGSRYPCTPISHSDDILADPPYVTLRSIENTSICIDEIQFLNEELATHAIYWAKAGARVFLAGLDLDSAGNVFGPMPDLLCIADEVIKLNAQCVVCGEDARRSQRKKDLPKSQILQGGADLYEARCLTHWEPHA